MEPPQTQPQVTKKSSNPTLWIVLVIVILVIAGYGVYAYMTGNANNTNTVVLTNQNTNTVSNLNTNIDTSDWQVYTNEKYGFSFRYPESLSVLTSDESLLFNSEVVNRTWVASSNPPIEIYIVNDSLETVKNYLEDREFTYYDKVAEWKTVQINRLQGEYTQKSYNSENDYFQNIYIFEKNNLVYVIYTFTNLGEPDTAISTFEIK